MTPGRGIERASWGGTGAFTVTATSAAAAPDAIAPVAFVVAVALFAAGCGAFAVAYARAVARSRREQITVGALFFLSGDVAPHEVRRSFLGSLGVEVAVALATAIARPYTSLAAGTLVPLYGLALCGLWASRHGRFPPRSQPPPSNRRR